MHNQLYMLSHQIPSYKTSHHIKNEVHSVTLILYEGIRYHNLYSLFSIIHVPKYVISLHYITFGLHLQITTIFLPLKWSIQTC